MVEIRSEIERILEPAIDLRAPYAKQIVAALDDLLTAALQHQEPGGTVIVSEGTDLPQPYKPAIIQFEDSGLTEFVLRDCATVYDWGDHYASIKDMETGEVIGFVWPTKINPAEVPGRRGVTKNGGPFRFRRYINGRLMAEGVTIEKQPTLEAAMTEAARIASRGPRSEVPVLVLDVTATPPAPSALDRAVADMSIAELHEAMRQLERQLADRLLPIREAPDDRR